MRARPSPLTATDANGNTSSPCNVTYTWTQDTTPPVLTCPSGPVALACNARPDCARCVFAQVSARTIVMRTPPSPAGAHPGDQQRMPENPALHHYRQG